MTRRTVTHEKPLDAAWSTAWIRGAAAVVAEHRDELTALDTAIGDGDHGINLDRGMHAVVAKLDIQEDAGGVSLALAGVLKATATTLLATVGGAAGPLLGTAFLKASRVCDVPVLSSQDVATLLSAAAAGVQVRGRAEIGDKTMLDAWQPAARAAREAVKAAGARRVREADRQTVMRSVAADPRATGWRRITHGGCKFCNMLAGRGEVYTADTVRFASHDHCRCTAVPAYGGPEVNVHQYTASKRKITEAERQQLKEYLDGVEDDGVTPRDEAVAAASAGGEPRPRTGTERHKWDKNESEAERYARQKRLWSDMSDLEPHDGLPREVLESHELDFLEHFEARGERVRWIRRSPVFLPTNDFVWTTGGDKVCELKSTTTKYRTISNRIRTAVIDAAARGVVKDVFIVDLGPHRLTRKLSNQLSRYNLAKDRGHIRRLFVMSRNGEDFEEITLAQA